MFRVFVALAICAASFCPLWAQDPPSARQIIQDADNLSRGKTSYAEITMRLVRKRWKREVSMKAWTQGNEKSFIVVLSPAKDAGTTFLKLGRQMWNYLPKVERRIKIPPSMMLQSWMGSDFTNDDVARADSMITDYTHKVVGEEIVEGKACWKIESIPLEDAPIFWGKVLTLVQKDGRIYRRQEFYNEDMEIRKVMTLDRVRDTSGRRVPTRYTMIDKKKPGNSTVLLFEKILFDVAIPQGTFSRQNLVRGGR